MNCLNHYCLVEIFKYVGLTDQLSLYATNDGAIQAAVINVWRRTYKTIHINFSLKLITNKEFVTFVRNIHDVVEVLHLAHLSKKKMAILNTFYYERVREFVFSLHRPATLHDRDLKNLLKIFPNLRELGADGHLTGQHIDQWPLLKHLDLKRCYLITHTHFRQITTNLRLERLKLNHFPQYSFCPTLPDIQLEHLQYLELNKFEFSNFLPKRLPNLRELVFCHRYSPSDLFLNIMAKWKTTDIELVETYKINNVLESCVLVGFHVENLTITCDKRALIFWRGYYVIQCLTALRKLRFVNCFFRDSDIYSLIRGGSQLRELHFEDCCFDEPLTMRAIKESCSTRINLLTLNLYGNTVTDCNKLLKEGIEIEREGDGGGEGEGVAIEQNDNDEETFVKVTYIESSKFNFVPFRALFK